MGQLTALLYKYGVLTKRQKSAFFCQILSPILGILLVWLILSQKDNFTPTTEGLFGSDVVPSSLYFSNMITPRWSDLWGDLFSIDNPVRIKRYATTSSTVNDMFQSWIQTQSNTLSFPGTADDGSAILYPKWERFNAETIEDLNEQLIKDVRYLNSLDKSELSSDQTLPDSSILLNECNMENGVDAHIQVNNIAFYNYHRMNGDTYASANNPATGTLMKTVYPTESAIGLFNLLSNMHFQHIFENDFVNVVSIVSQTVDSTFIDELIQSALAIVCNNMFPVSLCLGFPVMLFVLTMEKEEKIKGLLEINGLNVKSYWMSFFIYYFIILELTVGVWLMIGRLWIKIEFFQDANLLITFWLLTAWNLAQIGFSLFTSTFLKTSRTSTLVGYQGSIFLLLFLSIVSQFLFPNPSHMPFFFYILPQTGLVRFIYLSISKCIDYKCYNTLSDIQGEMLTIFITMHVSIVFYTILGLILNEPKVARYFRQWFKTKFVQKRSVVRDNLNSERTRLTAAGDVEDDKVENLKFDDDYEIMNIGLEDDKHISAKQYEQAVLNTKENDPRYELIAKGISKTFPCSQGLKKALTDFSLKIEKGKIFGLLGPNGAGKTTFLSIITGIVNADEGSGIICGHSIDDIGSHTGEIGFCPQFDILWPALNVEEHLIFMSMFKGISKKDSISMVKQLIKDVDLEDDYHKMAKQLSGGMKRRCSMAMSLTGSPRIIFLDEPSSGLDPVKRRHFWQLIQRVTQQKAVLLTTHLMEEADTLCNEIGIITTGKLRCIGNSLSLKAAFTEGVKLQVVMNSENRSEENIDNFLGILKDKLKDVKVESSFRGTLGLVIGSNTLNKSKQISHQNLESNLDMTEKVLEQSNEDKEEGNLSNEYIGSLGSAETQSLKLSHLFGQISTLAAEYLSDWSLSLGSLEDVFLSVVRRYRESNIVGEI